MHIVIEEMAEHDPMSPSIDLLVRAACDSGSGSESESNPTPTPNFSPRSRSNSGNRSGSDHSLARETSPTPPLDSRSHAGGRSPARRGNSLSLAKLAASRHRSSFAQRFFRDLVAGRVDAFREDGPHNVSVLQDERGSAASRSGMVSSASWRPKHQLRSAFSRHPLTHVSAPLIHLASSRVFAQLLHTDGLPLLPVHRWLVSR